MSTLNIWLKDKIAEKGIGISQIAYETGLTRASLYYLLRDINRPRRDNLQKICDVLGADIEEALALYTPKKVGRPVGSVKKWGQEPTRETILNNIEPDNPIESNKLPEYIDL